MAGFRAYLKTGYVSSVDRVQEYLNQIAEHESHLKAPISQPSHFYLLEQAKNLDRERTYGNVWSALRG